MLQTSGRFERMRRLGDAGLPNVEHQLKEIHQAARLSRLRPFQPTIQRTSSAVQPT